MCNLDRFQWAANKTAGNCKHIYFNHLAFRYQNQFGCGILKMVDPKKQDFWPKINIPYFRE